MEQKRYSPKTVKNYVNHITQFLRYYSDKPYTELSVEDVERYNHEVIIQNNLSVSFQRGMVGAVKLFYTVQERVKMHIERLQRPFKESRLPEVLSKEEVQKIINATQNSKHKALLSITYACGLRRSEVLNLRLKDLDSQRKLIRIEQAKGKKDRYVPFSSKLRTLLLDYYKAFKPKEFLFEGQYGGRYGERSFAQVLDQAKARTGIKKNITLHTLRHSGVYPATGGATHLLEKGVDIKYIKDLPGHFDIKTTARYLHVKREQLVNIGSPPQADDLLSGKEIV